MTRDEKRAIRREHINYWLHRRHFGVIIDSLCVIKTYVRMDEVDKFRRSLRLYYPKGK